MRERDAGTTECSERPAMMNAIMQRHGRREHKRESIKAEEYRCRPRARVFATCVARLAAHFLHVIEVFQDFVFEVSIYLLSLSV